MTSATNPRRKRRYARRLPVEERREQLLDAALRVIVRDGYEKVSVDAIAREVGVTRPVVYSAYDGLAPLLHALLDRTQQQAIDQVVALLEVAGDPAEDVDAWVVGSLERLLDVVTGDPDVWRPVLGLTAGAPAEVRARISATREELIGYLAAGLEVGLALRGGPFVNPSILARMALAVAEELGRLVLDDPDRHPREELVATLRALLDAARPGEHQPTD